jgi:hypothetical protein
MIRRGKRVTFRMTDWEHAHYGTIISSKVAGFLMSSWTDLCKMALRELWLKMGSPEPPAGERQTVSSTSDTYELFSTKRRPRPATRSAPTRPAKPKRARR